MTDLSKGKLLVTGGAGFIGSALVWELNQRGLSNILIADHLRTDEKWKNLVPLRFADYIQADDLESQLDSLGDITTVFHLGACSSTIETNAGYLTENNFEFTKMLAHFALQASRRFVYASSAATYGSSANGISEDVDLHSLRPLNMYGYSKHLFDLYARSSGFLPSVTSLKFFNVFGPNEYHKGDMRSVVCKAFNQINRTGRMSLFRSYRSDVPDGQQCRDFLYVKDAVAATVFLAEHVDGGGIFNIGSGQASSWLSLANALFTALKRTPEIEFVDMPETLRSNYQYYTSANISKLQKAGFTQAMEPLGSAISDYVNNYLLPARYLGDEQSS